MMHFDKKWQMNQLIDFKLLIESKNLKKDFEI